MDKFSSAHMHICARRASARAQLQVTCRTCFARIEGFQVQHLPVPMATPPDIDREG